MHTDKAAITVKLHLAVDLAGLISVFGRLPTTHRRPRINACVVLSAQAPMEQLSLAAQEDESIVQVCLRDFVKKVGEEEIMYLAVVPRNHTAEPFRILQVFHGCFEVRCELLLKKRDLTA